MKENDLYNSSHRYGVKEEPDGDREETDDPHGQGRGFILPG